MIHNRGLAGWLVVAEVCTIKWIDRYGKSAYAAKRDSEWKFSIDSRSCIKNAAGCMETSTRSPGDHKNNTAATDQPKGIKKAAREIA